MLTQLSALAYAKVNLHLGVGPAREDGFHELATVFQSLNLSDEVTLTLGAQSTQSAQSAQSAYSPDEVVASLSTSGPCADGVPEDERNLAWRAVQMVLAELGLGLGLGREVGVPKAHIHLLKNIPAAGGMAGGSANAAAALALANRAYSRYLGLNPLSREKLMELAARLGSDVPFTLLGGTALGTGRGEELTSMLCRGHYTWAIITNAVGLSTPEVFNKLDSLRESGRDLPAHMDTSAVAKAVMSGEPQVLAAALKNDLQAAAISLRPDLRKILSTGNAAGALAGVVSGSGPTCAFLCADPDTAAEVVAQVTADNRGTSGLVTTSPAPGVSFKDA